MNNLDFRAGFAARTQRIVVKVGSRALVNRNGRPDRFRLDCLVADISALIAAGKEVIVVSSGAIATGLDALGIRKKSSFLPDLQMAAAVGQTRLMNLYEDLFAKRRRKVGQVLLTHDDLAHRQRHLNARNTLLKLLENGVVPIVNENDAVSVDEIKFGDNDALASRVAMLVEADLLILLTTVNGFRMATDTGAMRMVHFLPDLPDNLDGHIHRKASHLSTGGMLSKLQSASEAARMGIPVVIGNGRKTGILKDIVAGKNVGTLLPPNPKMKMAGSTLNQRRRWVALFHKPSGQVTVDDGARDAILFKGKSLLPIGVRDVVGDFPSGALITVLALDGTAVGHGLSEYSADEVRLLKGLKTKEIQDRLGHATPGEVIHRDNLVIHPQHNKDS